MEVYPELSLLLSRRSAGGYNVDVSIFQPDSEAETGLPSGEESYVSFDLEKLNSLVYIPDEYGKQLASNLFASPAVRRAFEQAHDIATTLDLPLRVRLQVAANAPELHNLRWETLYDIQGEAPMFSGENILFSRYLSSPDMRKVRLRPKAAMRALVVVANPSDLPFYGLAAVDVDSEIARVRKSLGEIECDVMAGSQTGTPVTLDAIISRLRKGKYDILYLISHGTYVKDRSWLFLENEHGEVQRVSGDELTAQLENLRELPVLAVLLACESAGDGANPAIAALGPRLAEAGIPAVLAMQGKISMKTAEDFMPVYFQELVDEGRVDRATGLARNAVRSRPDFWMPVLYTRLKSGVIYAKPGDLAVRPRELQILNLRLVWLAVSVLALVLVTFGVGYWLFVSLREKPPEGGFRIAVASFAEVGNPGEKNLGEKLANEIALQLSKDLSEIQSPLVVNVHGPEQGVGVIKGETTEERAQAAAKIADKGGYFIVIFGVVNVTESIWRISPEFYISPKAVANLYEVDEFTGQHELGTPLQLAGQLGLGELLQLRQLTARTQALSLISIGLAYYSLHQYPQALESFQTVLAVPGWDDNQGKQVVYLFIGNAAGKSGQLDLAEKYFLKSLEIDPEYARAHVGLGSVYYLRALEPSQATGDPQDANAELLEQSIQHYNGALTAIYKPPLADIETKVHFGLGQAYTILNIVKGNPNFELAITEFTQVIADFDNGTNPRVRELAAESHARLGLIYLMQNEIDRSIKEYEQAVALLDNNPERQALYKSRIEELK